MSILGLWSCLQKETFIIKCIEKEKETQIHGKPSSKSMKKACTKRWPIIHKIIIRKKTKIVKQNIKPNNKKPQSINCNYMYLSTVEIAEDRRRLGEEKPWCNCRFGREEHFDSDSWRSTIWAANFKFKSAQINPPEKGLKFFYGGSSMSAFRLTNI